VKNDPIMIEEPNPLILIVDDTNTNIQILAQTLLQDYRVKFATSGQAALQLASGPEKPDLILLDVMMPEMDGYEVCRRLQDKPSTHNIPIIFVTAKSDIQDQEYGFNLGAVDYIIKPFEMPVVRARVRNHINLKRKTELLEKLALLDGLTNIPNRRRFDEVLRLEWKRAARNHASLSLLMIDVDHFKAFNDNYGHGAGDECLRRVAYSLNKALFRAGDVVARYGGEEFAVVLPKCNADNARNVAERIRATVETLNILHRYADAADHITVSIGYAALVPNQNGDPHALVEAADRSLFLAKQGGRNRVCG
jgi:diguanylate cyclase (GGDEF)-like protein